MSLPIVVVGAGGHGKVLADTLRAAGHIVLGFVDADASKWNTRLDDLPILGSDHAIETYAAESIYLANGIGSTDSLALRRAIYLRFHDRGYRFATVVHPGAVVSSNTKIREGAQIMAGAIVQPGVQIGVNSIVNTGAIVDHDCIVGEHCHLAPGSTLSGGVTVGSETHVGVGATVIQGVSVGRSVLIAAGSVVVRDVPDWSKVLGVPAREQKT